LSAPWTRKTRNAPAPSTEGCEAAASVPSTDGLVTKRLSTSWAGNSYRSSLQPSEKPSTLRAVWFAIRAVSRRWDVGNAELTASVAAHESSPETGSTCLAPTKAQLSAGIATRTATVLYDRPQDCVRFTCLTSWSPDSCRLARGGPGRLLRGGGRRLDHCSSRRLRRLLR
jgi:hypothetical protein